MMIDFEKLSASVPRDESEYIADDGLLHCRKCGGSREVIIKLFGKMQKVHCICKCIEEKIESENRQSKWNIYESNRRICFRGSSHSHCTFSNSEQTEDIKVGEKYAENFDKFKAEGKGIIFHGRVGSGKSHIAACIANAVIDKGYKAYMTNVPEIVNTLQSSFEGRQTFIDSLNDFHLLVLDDLGVERKTEYMTEQVFNIIDSRYRSGLPMIVTTNLSRMDMASPSTIENARIYDRIAERCLPIEIKGASRRRQNARTEFGEMKELLKGD